LGIWYIRDGIENSVKQLFVVVVVFLAARTYVPSRCYATTISSGSTIPLSGVERTDRKTTP
jgi:hypothetical protein